MPIEQVRFLGSSITGFSANLGWGTQESRLQVGLVDDVRNGDGFNPPDVGAPVQFNYEGWIFNGILEHYGRDRGFGGNPIYNVSVVDPRVLLDGVQIILSDYFGMSFIPNILNVFGYLENAFGFGGSNRNDSGIPYGLISTSVMALTAGLPSIYGSPISYKGFGYTIDITELPLLPAYYRVSATPSMSLMEYINEICDAGACEYFFTLEGNQIILHTLSRKNVPVKGLITQFVNNTQGCVANSVGLDMVNETCSKMVIGGPVSDIFFSVAGTGSDGSINSSIDNPVWYYWGIDNNGNLITSNGPNQDFRLDSRSVLIPGVGDTYPTDIGEMRSALASQDSWEMYLWFNCFNKFEFDPEGEQTDYIYQLKNNIDARNGENLGIDFVPSTTAQYKHSGYPNPHFEKAYLLGVNPVVDFNIVQTLLDSDPDTIIASNLRELLFANHSAQFGLSNDETDDMSKLYGLIQSYAQEYYGLKFMVIVPNVLVRQDSDTGEFSFSDEVVDAGYLTDQVISTAVNSNMMPVDATNITTSDNRITAYVRFDNIELLDMRSIAPEDLMFGQNLIKNAGGADYQGTNSIFIKCSVDDNFVFVDNNFNSPRAVITLSSRIFTAPELRYGERIIVDFLTRAAQASVDTTYDEATLSEVANKFMFSSFGDTFSLSAYAQPVIPNMVAIPLQSNILTYGPWYAAGANGKVEIEQAEDLVPWNYGGYINMAFAATARVEIAIANLQWVESGSVEFPGAPSDQLGDQLLESGPYITDIRVTAGVDGVKTAYSMKSWNPQFGKSAKTTIDKITRIAKNNQQIKRNMKQAIKNNTFKATYLNIKNQLPNIQ